MRCIGLRVALQSCIRVIWVSSIVSFLFVAASAWVLFEYFKVSTTEAASWVQAIGSIVAIFGSYLIGSSITEKAHELEKMRDKNRREKDHEGYLIIINEVKKLADENKNLFEKDVSQGLACFFFDPNREENIKSVISALKLIPINLVKKPMSLIRLINVMNVLADFYTEARNDQAVFRRRFEEEKSSLWNSANVASNLCDGFEMV